jgi:pterin-4a-carbinolamine dehydratase
MTIEWQPSSGILSPSEVGRALESRPGWHRRDGGLVRELQCRDFAVARGLADRLADEVSYYGRRPEIAIHDDGRLVVTLAGPNHAGVTVADLRMADMIDGVVERHARDGDAWDARAVAVDHSFRVMTAHIPRAHARRP